MGHYIKELFTVFSIAASVVLTDAATTVTGFSQTEAAHVTVTSPLTSVTAAATTITLAENFGTGTITTFRAIAAANATATGTWASSNTTAVTIASDNGAVAVPITLDYEKLQSLTVTLTFTENSTAGGTIALTLTVTDVNDNPPVFNPTTYIKTVANASLAGTVATTVTATDSDGSAANNVITYSISAGNTDIDWTINGTGAIAVATGKQLSKTRTSSYTLTVLATDNGTPKLNGTANVTITVDNCTAQSKPAHGKITTTTATTRTVVTLRCDAGYTLAGANSTTCQTNGKWNVTLGACNAITVTGFKQSVTFPATVASPLIHGPAAATTIALAENFTAGTITTFTALDAANVTVTSGTWKSSNATVAAISSSGAVTVPSLDYETEQSLTITLTFTVGGASGATSTIVLTLTVKDVNDNPPVFNLATYNKTVANASTAGTVATTVTATDSDGSTANNVITYSISAIGNTGSDWTINDTGVIAVATGKTLSKTRTPSYTLIVLATDSGAPKLNGTATVIITVDDCAAQSKPAHGKITTTTATMRTVVTLRCDAGYTLAGANATTCQTNGKWTVALGACNGDVKNSADGVGGILLLTGVCGVVAMLFKM